MGSEHLSSGVCDSASTVSTSSTYERGETLEGNLGQHTSCGNAAGSTIAKSAAPAPAPAGSGATGASGDTSSSATLVGSAAPVIHFGRIGLTELVSTLAPIDHVALAPAGTDGTRPRFLGLGFPGAAVHVLDLLGLGDLGPLARVLSNKKIIGHDLQELLAGLQTRFHVHVATAVDTMLMARVVDGGRHHDLDEYFAFEPTAFRELADYKSDLTRPDQQPVVDQIRTAARRAAALLPLWSKLKTTTVHENLQTAVDIENNFLPSAVDLATNGVRVDRRRWVELVASRGARALQLGNEIAAELHIDNARDAKAVIEGLRLLGVEIEGKGKAALAPHISVPVVQKVLEFRRLDAFLNDQGSGVHEALNRSPDGRGRSEWRQIGCATGRMSTRDPNLLGIPRDPEVRSCFVPEPGNVFVVADYRAIELCILAEVTKDQRLIEIFLKGGDPHRTTAAVFAGKGELEVTAEERKYAKPVNFGLAFGMGPTRLIEYAAESFGVTLTPQQAERYIAVYRQTFPGVRAWQERTSINPSSSTRTLGGRLRHFEDHDSYCAQLNSPIQGTCADGVKLSAALMRPNLVELDARLVLIVHDEFVVEVPNNKAEKARRAVVAAMKEGMERFVTAMSIEVDARISPSWAKL